METSGLPAMVISARICPSPGVSISSARHDTGSSPRASGRPAHAAVPAPDREALAAARLADGVALARRRRAVNIAPPSRSRLPVSTFTTSTSQLASVPNSWVQVPIRPYTAARVGGGQLARHPADLVGLDAAGAGHLLGREGARQLLDLVEPVEVLAEAARGRSGPRRTACARSPNSRCASPPGRMKWCSSAASAVRVRRGSITTTLPPRSRMARRRPRMSGAVSRLPLETSGLAPRISRWSVRSTSGTGIDSGAPNIRPGGHVLGHLVDGARREDVLASPRARSHTGP